MSPLRSHLRIISRYLRSIGARGGRKSRRTLDPETARAMVKVREARRVGATLCR